MRRKDSQLAQQIKSDLLRLYESATRLVAAFLDVITLGEIGRHFAFDPQAPAADLWKKGPS